MLKLYKVIDGMLHYHEAWVNGSELIEHWGIAGEQGETRTYAVDRSKSDDDNVRAALKERAEYGYQPIDPEGQHTLLIEYLVVGMGTKADLAKRHRLEDRMNDTLGWTGLGNCDGGSIGSGSMEVCCYVVDFDLAKRAIAKDLENTEFADYSRIYDENAV